MKNLFNSLAIIVLLASVNTTQAQLPQMKSEVFTPSPDGKIYLSNSIISARMELYNFTSSSYTARTTKVRDVLREATYVQQKGQKWVITQGILAYPDVDTLQLRMATNNYTAPFGNFVVSSSGTNPLTSRVKTFSLNGQNDGQYVPINTTDGTWTDAVYEGVSGFKFKKWVWEIDSIPPSQCDANGLFYYICEITVESLRHPLGNAPYIAPYYFSGPVSGPHKMTDIWRSAAGIKKVDASFTSASLDPVNPSAVSTHNSIRAGFGYYPTNYYNSTNCKKLGIMFSKKVGNSWILIHDTMMSPYWDRVDEVNTGNSRTDEQGFGTEIHGLQDTSLFKVELYSFLNNQKTIEKTQEIYTKKLYVEPVVENLITSNVTHNSATLTFTYRGGNMNTTPFKVVVTTTAGTVYTQTFNSQGDPNELITQVINLNGLRASTEHVPCIKKDELIISTKPPATFTTLPEPIVITTIDPWSWTADAVTGSPDGLTAVQTIKCTPGNDGASMYILITDPMGHAIEKTVLLDAATKTISIDGLGANTLYTFKLYFRVTGKPDELQGTFSWKSAGGGDGTVGINTTVTTELNVYPNPVTDILYVDNLKKGTEIKLSDLMGRVVSSTTEQTMNTERLPVGIYFLQVNNQVIKVEKR